MPCSAAPFGIYLHIPYCPAKCRYCDFFSRPGCRAVPQDYCDALARELRKNSRRPDTLYFGGGTPALLSPAQAARLIEAADPLPGAEITLEANPDVVDPEKLKGFAAAGVTRVSFGVQSTDDGPAATAGPYPHRRRGRPGAGLGGTGRICRDLRGHHAGAARILQRRV